MVVADRLRHLGQAQQRHRAAGLLADRGAQLRLGEVQIPLGGNCRVQRVGRRTFQHRRGVCGHEVLQVIWLKRSPEKVGRFVQRREPRGQRIAVDARRLLGILGLGDRAQRRDQVAPGGKQCSPRGTVKGLAYAQVGTADGRFQRRTGTGRLGPRQTHASRRRQRAWSGGLGSCLRRRGLHRRGRAIGQRRGRTQRQQHQTRASGKGGTIHRSSVTEFLGLRRDSVVTAHKLISAIDRRRRAFQENPARTDAACISGARQPS